MVNWKYISVVLQVFARDISVQSEESLKGCSMCTKLLKYPIAFLKRTEEDHLESMRDTLSDLEIDPLHCEDNDSYRIVWMYKKWMERGAKIYNTVFMLSAFSQLVVLSVFIKEAFIYVPFAFLLESTILEDQVSSFLKEILVEYPELKSAETIFTSSSLLPLRKVVHAQFPDARVFQSVSSILSQCEKASIEELEDEEHCPDVREKLFTRMHNNEANFKAIIKKVFAEYGKLDELISGLSALQKHEKETEDAKPENDVIKWTFEDEEFMEFLMFISKQRMAVKLSYLLLLAENRDGAVRTLLPESFRRFTVNILEKSKTTTL